MRRGFVLVLFCLTCPVFAAPELSDANRQRHADGTSDRDAVLDGQDGLYVLLRNAARWQGDDFGGDAGAATAPPPDYGFIKQKPEQARGNVYLIEGWLAGADRWPTQDNHDTDKLMRAGDPSWGDQVTRWTIVTEENNPEATIIVLFNDPGAKMTAPKPASPVRVAARFHKLWTIPGADGKPFNYITFVGGAAEQTENAQASSSDKGSGSPVFNILALIAVVGGFFVAMRFLMRRLSTRGGGGHQLQDRLEEMRRSRESHSQADEGEEDADDLPDDPVEALGVLREKHGD